MEKQEFNWTSNEYQDDFTCNIEGYCLRAEQMQKNIWWWAVYLPDDEQVDSYTDNIWCKTKEEALAIAQKTYLSLLSLQESKPV